MSGVPAFLLPDFMRDRGPRTCTDFYDAQDWDELKTKFDTRLVFKAASYKPFRLFDIKPCEMSETLKAEMPKSKCAVSPSGRFRYTEVVLKKGHWLDCVQGNRKGACLFFAQKELDKQKIRGILKEVSNGESPRGTNNAILLQWLRLQRWLLCR